MTPQYLYHPYILYHLPTMPTSKLSTCTLAYWHPLNETYCTQHCSIHSVLHKNNPYLPCPAAIRLHNITYTPTCHTDHALLMHSTASAYKTVHICHAAQQLHCSHPQYNSLSMHTNMHYTPGTIHSMHTNMRYTPGTTHSMHCLPQLFYAYKNTRHDHNRHICIIYLCHFPNQ